MPTRIGEAERIGGSDRLPIWRIALSEEPTAEWRRRFLRLAHEGGIFHGPQIRVEAGTLVFEIEPSALRLACDKIDQWIAGTNGVPVAVPTANAILVVDDEHEVTRLARDMLQPVGWRAHVPCRITHRRGQPRVADGRRAPGASRHGA